MSSHCFNGTFSTNIVVVEVVVLLMVVVVVIVLVMVILYVVVLVVIVVLFVVLVIMMVVVIAVMVAGVISRGLRGRAPVVKIIDHFGANLPEILVLVLFLKVYLLSFQIVRIAMALLHGYVDISNRRLYCINITLDYHNCTLKIWTWLQLDHTQNVKMHLEPPC